MGVIAGIVHLDGGEACGGDLEQVLQRAQGGRPAKTLGTVGVCLGRVGLAQSLPTALRGGDCITGVARLDNRDELTSLLQIGNHESLALSDECLMARAFERWGEACPQHLNGDWSFAVWSPTKKRLFLARDHFGNSCLYYARLGERVAFASDLTALLSLRWLPRRLNEVRIASLLAGIGVDEPQSTAYLGVSRLPPAHTASFSTEHDRINRYWCLEDTPESSPRSVDERAESLRATLRTAVHSRLGSGDSIGSMLSGGLDSGAVTAFAAENLQGKGKRLTAFTSVPAFPSADRGGPCIDEGPSAAELARSFESIDHVLVPARTVSPIAGIRRTLAVLSEPPIPAGNYGWITELMSDAQARGMAVLLTGQVGDFVMAGRPEAPSWQHDLSAGRYRSMLRRVAPNSLVRLQRAGWKPWRLGDSPWSMSSLVNRSFADDVKLADHLRDAGRDPGDLQSHAPAASAIRRRATADTGGVWGPLGASFGLVVLDPLQDKRVMEQMFASPRPAAGKGADRWLFRQSLVGVLPESVRISRSKGVQSADIAERLVASWSEVEEALAQAEASPLARRCVDLRYCRSLAESLRSAQPPQQARRNALTFCNGISTALFLAES